MFLAKAVDSLKVLHKIYSKFIVLGVVQYSMMCLHNYVKQYIDQQQNNSTLNKNCLNVSRCRNGDETSIFLLSYKKIAVYLIIDF